MRPEANKTQTDIWILVQLGVGINASKPYTVMTHNECYYTLAEAQQAQTFEALKHSIKYHIFHLEFPNV